MLLMKQRAVLKEQLKRSDLTNRERNYIEKALRSKRLANEHLAHGVLEFKRGA